MTNTKPRQLGSGLGMAEKSGRATSKAIAEGPEPPGADSFLLPTVPWDVAAHSQRDRILQAMAECCAEKTYAKTTIADIVTAAGISRATFYKHFADKKVCFQAVADDFIQKLRSAVAESIAEDPTSDRVQCAASVLLEQMAAEPAQAKLLLLEAPNVDTDIVLSCRGLVMERLEAELRAVGQTTVIADPELSFGRAKVLLASCIAAGGAERLPSLLPELLYIALLPFVGQQVALDQARLAR